MRKINNSKAKIGKIKVRNMKEIINDINYKLKDVEIEFELLKNSRCDCYVAINLKVIPGVDYTDINGIFSGKLLDIISKEGLIPLTGVDTFVAGPDDCTYKIYVYPTVFTPGHEDYELLDLSKINIEKDDLTSREDVMIHLYTNLVGCGFELPSKEEFIQVKDSELVGKYDLPDSLLGVKSITEGYIHWCNNKMIIDQIIKYLDIEVFGFMKESLLTGKLKGSDQSKIEFLKERLDGCDPDNFATPEEAASYKSMSDMSNPDNVEAYHEWLVSDKMRELRHVIARGMMLELANSKIDANMDKIHLEESLNRVYDSIDNKSELKEVNVEAFLVDKVGLTEFNKLKATIRQSFREEKANDLIKEEIERRFGSSEE